MDHKGRTRWVAAAAALMAIVTSVAFSEFRLSDQSSEVYYNYAAVAGVLLQVEKDAEITGDVHSNGDVQLKKDSLVHGDVAAAGALVDSQGTVSGMVTEGAAALGLPAILDPATLRALADRVFEDDEIVFTDEVIDDVVFVAGTLRLRGAVSGTGTVIAGGDVRVDSTGQGQGGGGAPPLDAATRLSLIAVNDVRIGKDRAFRGVLRAGHDVEIEQDVDLEGVVIADNELHIKQGSRVRFVDFDETPPVVTLVEPADGSFVAAAAPRIELAFADDFSGVRAASTVFLLDGTERTADAAVSAEGLVFTPEEALAEGLHTIEAVIFDHSDNEGRGSFSFTVDTEPPAITVDTPADGATVFEPTVAVTGTVTDEVGVESVTVDGQAAILAGSSFSASATLVPGLNAITVTAADVLGNTGSVVVNVTLEVQTDRDPPSLAIVSPLPGVLLANARPDLEVSFDDDETGVDAASLAFTANGAPLEAACALLQVGGAVCTPSADLPNAAIQLRASVRDFAGNGATASVSFTVDTVGVEVSLTSPEDGLLTAADEVSVAGSVGEGVASVSVNGIAAQLAGSFFSATVPLREGVNMVVALATKSNGNTGAASIEVTRDVVAPIVHVDSPRDGFVAVSDAVAVTGLVNDVVTGGVGPVVTVNGRAAAVDNGTFLLESLELVPGPNQIEAVAIDGVGNTGRHTVTVHFQQPVGARIGIASGNGQSGRVREALAEPLVAVVTDDLGNPVSGRVVKFEVTRNSGVLRTAEGGEPRRSVQVPTDGSGRAAAFLILGDAAGAGNNRVRATGLGVAGEVEFCATARAAAADKVLMVGGDNQRGLVGNPLPLPLAALVVDADGNPLAGVEVTFTVVQGTGSLGGEASLVRATGIDGVARAVLTLGFDPGINNNVASASIADLPGLPATFTASGLLAGDPADTRLSGVVLDNGHTPIPAAEVSIGGTSLTTVTDDQGKFSLADVPVGHLELHIDPASSPRPETFPHLAFETVTVAGQNNTIGQPILIPAIDVDNSKVVGGDQDVTLAMEGVEELTLTVFAESVTFPDGSRTGRVSISQVHLDKVPMAPPNGTIFMPPAWTIQPAGVHFDPPARITIPNDGLPPGRVIDVFQFDHTLNQFINVGKGTVSEDGRVITSDPGFGITRAGWGGFGPPQPPQTCTCQCDDGNECTSDRCTGQPLCLCFYERLTNSGCCDGRPYDPATQGCCDGEDIYAPETQCCADGEVVPKKPIPFGDLLDCTERFQCPTWVRQFDGCSLPASPGFDKDNPAGGSDTQFAVCQGRTGTCPNPRACDTHDICYQTCYSGGPFALITAKARCDVGMWRDMRATCSASQENFLVRQACLDVADVYYIGLRLGGDYAFLSRQYNDVCQCCP